MNKIKGSAFLFGDNLNTDYIISGKYKFKTLDMDELAKHVMEDIRPGFYNEIEKGDFVVAGENFGAGSSREQAPLVLKVAGVGALIAKSFARIFYRNCINVGLPVVEVDTTNIEEGDELEVDVEKGIVINVTKGITLEAKPLPEVMMKILSDGGLAEHIKKNGDFALDDEESSE
ncbi:MAG: 3-isopropylmalate dehydratase small subunit [Euryarchaeota archaeon]|nr:3-isopropylmalate dehydratase small subunit [Euryarchaeota archaeon]